MERKEERENILISSAFKLKNILKMYDLNYVAVLLKINFSWKIRDNLGKMHVKVKSWHSYYCNQS